MTPTLRVPLAGLGALRRRARPAARAVLGRPPRRRATTGPTTGCCCSSTRTSTRSGVRADLANVLVPPGRGRGRAGAGRPRGRRHLPRARPARRLPDPVGARQAGRGHGRHRRLRARSVEQLVIDALADLGLPDAGRLDRLPGRVGRPRRAERPARSPPSACGSPGAARCTASPSTSAPDLTLLRPHRPVRHRRQGGDVAGRRGRRRRDARGRRRRRRPGRRALGRRRRPGSATTWCGATAPRTCRRSAAAQARDRPAVLVRPDHVDGGRLGTNAESRPVPVSIDTSARGGRG